MAKRIEATKYIKRDDILAYPLRRATCDKEKANTRFVDGVEAAMEYAEKLPFVECKAYAQNGEKPEKLELKNVTVYVDLADLLKCPLRDDAFKQTFGDWHFWRGVESVMEYAESLPAVRVKMNREIEDKRPLCDLIKANASLVCCKDCEYSYEDIAGLMRCYKGCKGNADRIVREDFFCADGVKREEAKRNEKGD